MTTSKTNPQVADGTLPPVVGIRVPRCNAAKQTAAMAVEHGGPDATVVPFTVAARMEREVREAVKILKALLYDMPMIDCDFLNHRKRDQHPTSACPVEERMLEAVEKARLFIRNSNPKVLPLAGLGASREQPVVGGPNE